MVNLQEIKARIKSVGDTQKITNAMYLIASNEVRRARRDFDKARPYFDELRTEIKRVFRTLKQIDHPYVYPDDLEDFKNGRYGILVISSDRSLAGAYNQEVIGETTRLIESHPEVKLFVVGEYGRKYFAKAGVEMQEDFNYSPAHANLETARQISTIMLDQFDAGILKKIFVVYTNQQEGGQKTISTRLLPFHRGYFADTKDSKNEKKILHEFSFLPSPEKVLDVAIVSYIQGFIYGALVDSFCSEANSRIQAMKQADDNAKNILLELGLERNQVRQAQITEEINEVSAGAKAQQKERSARHG